MYRMIGENQIKEYDNEPLKKFAGSAMICYVVNPTDEQLLEFGYKPLTETTMPVREGYYYTPTYTERENDILQGWTEHECDIVEQTVEDDGQTDGDGETVSE